MLSDEEIHGIFYPMGGASDDQLQIALGCARAIESAATAPLLARIAELEKDVAHKDAYSEQLGRELANATRELEEARKDAEAFTDEQLEAAVKAWFQEKIVPGKFPFHKRMRAAIAAAIKEQT